MRENVAVIGASNAVHIFRRNTSNAWQQIMKIVPRAADGATGFRPIQYAAGSLVVSANDVSGPAIFVYHLDLLTRTVRWRQRFARPDAVRSSTMSPTRSCLAPASLMRRAPALLTSTS